MTIRVEPSAVSSGSNVINSYNRLGKEIGAEGITESFIVQRTSIIANETVVFIYGTDSDYSIDRIRCSPNTPNVIITLLSPSDVVLNTFTITSSLFDFSVLYTVPKGHKIRITAPTLGTVTQLICKLCHILETIII